MTAANGRLRAQCLRVRRHVQNVDVEADNLSHIYASGAVDPAKSCTHQMPVLNLCVAMLQGLSAGDEQGPSSGFALDATHVYITRVSMSLAHANAHQSKLTITCSLLHFALAWPSRCNRKLASCVSQEL